MLSNARKARADKSAEEAQKTYELVFQKLNE
jgi:hypothetical protein